MDRHTAPYRYDVSSDDSGTGALPETAAGWTGGGDDDCNSPDNSRPSLACGRRDTGAFLGLLRSPGLCAGDDPYLLWGELGLRRPGGGNPAPGRFQTGNHWRSAGGAGP